MILELLKCKVGECFIEYRHGGASKRKRIKVPNIVLVEIPHGKRCRYFDRGKGRYFSIEDVDDVLGVIRSKHDKTEYKDKVKKLYPEDYIELYTDVDCGVYASEKWLLSRIGGEVNRNKRNWGSGWSLQLRSLYNIIRESTVQKEYREKKKNSIVYYGREFKNIRELSEYTGVKDSLLRDRIRRGMSVEKAVEYDGLKSTAVNYKGVDYENLKELADEVGVSYSTLYTRVKRGMTIEKAISMGVHTGIHFDGRNFNNLKDLARYHGLSYSKLYRNVSKGEELEEAVGRLLREELEACRG